MDADDSCDAFGNNTDLCVYRIHNEIATSLGEEPLLDGCESMYRHTEWLQSRSNYLTLFVKTMHERKYINYVPFRDYLSHMLYFFLYKNPAMIIKQDNQMEWIVANFVVHYCKMRFVFNMNMRAIRQMLTSHEIRNIYACCIPEYVKYCLDEIAKRRGLLALMHEICANTTCDSLVERVIADEVTIATISGFL